MGWKETDAGLRSVGGMLLDKGAEKWSHRRARCICRERKDGTVTDDLAGRFQSLRLIGGHCCVSREAAGLP